MIKDTLLDQDREIAQVHQAERDLLIEIEKGIQGKIVSWRDERKDQTRVNLKEVGRIMTFTRIKTVKSSINFVLMQGKWNHKNLKNRWAIKQNRTKASWSWRTEEA